MQFYTCSFGGWDSTYIVLLHTLMMLQGFWTPLRCTASPSQLKVGHFREHPNPNGFMDTYHPVIKHGNGKSLYKWRLKNGKHSGVSIVMFDYRRVWRFFQERFMDCAISCIGNCNQQGINPTYFILQAVILSHCHVAHVFFTTPFTKILRRTSHPWVFFFTACVLGHAFSQLEQTQLYKFSHLILFVDVWTTQLK